MIMKILPAAILAAFAAGSAQAASFVNGAFEDGNTNGWTVGSSGYKGGVSNATLTPADFLPGGTRYNTETAHSAIINSAYTDTNIGSALGSTIYSGNYSYRVEDTFSGGYGSAISQTVLNYTDANIFFAWKAVLQNGGHDDDSSALMMLTLVDNSDSNKVLISRTYNAGNGGGGVDARFSTQGSFFYTPQWQIEQLAIDSSLAGHTFTLSVLAADCSPTGHTGYVYLDGFGAVTPPVTDVPEPGSMALLGLGLAGLVAVRRRKSA